MTTYTDHLKLRKPDVGQTSWADEEHDNKELLDFFLGGEKAGNVVINGLVASDGGGLAVDYTSGEASVDGTRHTIASGSKTCTASVKNFLCVDSSGVVQLYTTAPAGAYAALAVIDAGAAAIDRIGDHRKIAEGAAAFDLDYTPENYAPDTGEVKEIEQHLAGIDGQLGLLGGFKNKIINGNYDIWQRGTTQTADYYGSADRWENRHVGSSKTVSQQAFTLGQADVPNNPKYFMRTVVSSVTGTNNLVYSRQKIEGVETLSGETAVLSFYAKADAARDIAVQTLQYFGSGGSPSATVHANVNTCNLTTSWQKFELELTIDSVSGKTKGTDNMDSLMVCFWFDAGSGFDYRTNSLGHQSGTFDLAQVQLEAGTVTTPFERRPIGVELALCQRYYWQGASPGSGYARQYGVAGNNLSAFNICFPVSLRLPVSCGVITAPTYQNCTFWGISLAADGMAFRVDVTADGQFRAYGGEYFADAEL